MAEPAYVAIAGEYARRIRGGELAPGTQLPSLAEMVRLHGDSDIVMRKAIELLQRQGLVRRAPRRGVFVADRPNLVRTSPERQQQGPEETFRTEFGGDVRVEREIDQVPATEELAAIFGISVDDELSHVVTRAADDGRPISISDTYQPLDVEGASSAVVLEETVADRLPAPEHAEWLGTRSGDLVKAVRQRFVDSTGRVIMVSDVSYPFDRYDAFAFRMALTPGEASAPTDD